MRSIECVINKVKVINVLDLREKSEKELWAMLNKYKKMKPS